MNQQRKTNLFWDVLGINSRFRTNECKNGDKFKIIAAAKRNERKPKNRLRATATNVQIGERWLSHCMDRNTEIKTICRICTVLWRKWMWILVCVCVCVCVRMRLRPRQQVKIALHCRNIFADSLLTEPLETFPVRLSYVLRIIIPVIRYSLNSTGAVFS